MEKLTLFLLFANILLEDALDDDQTKKNENMNGGYLIANNPNSNDGEIYSTMYSSRPNIKYFDIYSPPIYIL